MTSIESCSSAQHAVLVMRTPAEVSPWETKNMRLPPAVQRLKNELLHAEHRLGINAISQPEEPTPRLQPPPDFRSMPTSRASLNRRPHTSGSTVHSSRNGIRQSMNRERRTYTSALRPRTASLSSQRPPSDVRVSRYRTSRSSNQGTFPAQHLLADVYTDRAMHEAEEGHDAVDGEAGLQRESEQIDDEGAVMMLPPAPLTFPSTPGWSVVDTSRLSTRRSDSNCIDSAASTVPVHLTTTSELLTLSKHKYKHNEKPSLKNSRHQSNIRRGSSTQRQQEVKERRDRMEQQQTEAKIAYTRRRKSIPVPKVRSGNLAMHWMTIVAAVKKYRVLHTYLQHLRNSHILDDEMKQQVIAVRTIECWYIVARTRSKIIGKPSTARALRKFLLHVMRTQNTEKRKAATDTISTFLADFLPHKCLLSSMQQFRARIVNLQRYIRGWVACQHARLQLLYLAFERELKLRKAELVLQWKTSGRPAAVTHHPHTIPSSQAPLQHLNSVREQVKILLGQAENMMCKSSTKTQHKQTKALTASMKFILAIDSKRLEQLRAILKNQRRRQVVADAEAFKQRTTPEARLVTTEDVKVMLAGSNERMMKIFFERAMGIARQRHSLFLLMTSGGLEELQRLIDRDLTSRAMMRGMLRSYKNTISSS